ncbi:MAG: glycosyltransferase family 39 protein [Akkermansiaceae bacterium]
MSINSSQVDTGIIVRRSLFFLVLLILTLGNLFVLFQGLNSPQAMDQAQISREIARGNGFTTKMIRPVAYHQAESAQNTTISFQLFPDTYHSPLNPLLNAAVLKLIGADDPEAWQMNEMERIFPLDRVIAVVSTLFFLMAIGVTYLLISRIFDAKIAGVTAILMLFCEVFWRYSLSGLPQMLMLLLFSCAIYFVYRAVEAAAEKRIAMTPAIIAGVFFTLLALSHWMTVWIALGYIIFAAIAFRPRGIVALSILALLLVPAIFVMIRNYGITGSPFGTAFLTLYGGLGSGSELSVMRNTDLQAEPLALEGLMSKILRTALLQLTDIIPFLAGIVVAPLFFLSLLHPFKRAAIANFRWAILLMWISCTVGLAFFGISRNPLDPNQLHLLFAPIMTAYGLAFISILWSRLEIVTSTPMLRNVHHIMIIGICALPLILSLPLKVRIGMHHRNTGVPHWPPYFAPALNSSKMGLKGFVSEKQIVVSDQPWAVAWYADRMSVWLPPTREGFVKIEENATDLQTPIAGILISPLSNGSGPISEVALQYRDFIMMVMDGRAFFPNGVSLFDRDPKIQDIARRYPHRQPLFTADMIYYSDRLIRLSNPGGNQ